MLGREVHLRLLAAHHRHPAGEHGRQPRHHRGRRMDSAARHAQFSRIPFGSRHRQPRGGRGAGHILRQ